MTDMLKNERIICGECKHHLCIREDMHKVVCSVTLEFRGREEAALCEFAARKEPAGPARYRDN